MSFWPLPTSLIECFRAAARRGPVVELGAGAGGFARRLRSLGLEALLLDLHPSGGFSFPSVCGDLLKLPLREESAGLLILANSLRHVRMRDRRKLAPEVEGALAAGGAVAILEDAPEAANPRESNYREALALLARFDPGRSGALAPETARALFEPEFGAPAQEGRRGNEERVENPLAPLHWMRARPRLPFAVQELEDLEASVRRWGMAYGDFWYQVYVKGAR